MAKKRISARISPLAKKLLDLEKKKAKESDGEVIERCLYAHIRTPDALKLMREEIDKDPSLKPIFDALLQAHNKEQK